MNRSQRLPKRGSGNATGNTPRPRPLGKQVALLPVLPITFLYNVNKGKEGNRTRLYAYTRIKDDDPVGNSNRQQGGPP